MSTSFLDDYLDLEPFAAQVGRHPRSVRRWMNMRDGLPYAKIGNRILIHLPTAREWLFSRMHPNSPPRRRTQNGRMP
jgi:hypothetical protein